MSTGGEATVIEAGASELEGKLVSSGGIAGRALKSPQKILGKSLKSNIVPAGETAAFINPSQCINCGTCREICPAQAIKENQRMICHVCPTCTEQPGISVGIMKSLPTQTSCTTQCPLGISPQGYLGLTKAGKFEEAYELIWEKNPLISVCARICHHPCEDGCKRGILVDEPIKIREVKRYLDEKINYTPKKYVRMWEEKIAIIGSGPAGLTAGHYLARAGYDVTIFEADTEAGGMLVRAIPEFRLDREAVRAEIARLVYAGLTIKLNHKLNQYSIEELKSEYDALIVATGSPNSRELFIEGWRNAGIMTAMNFMEHVNNRQKLRRHLGQLFKFDGGKAVVIGGGSVAMDVARTAVRVGASKVTVVSLESGDQFPAHPWEKAEALEEGVEIVEGYSPVKFQADLFPTLKGIKFARVSSFTKDENGKISFTVDESSTIEIEADWVVEAIGQGRETFWDAVKEDGVFFAGDVASNKCSVVDAMASGRQTAFAVDAALRGRALRDPAAEKAERLVAAPVGEKLFPYNFRKLMRPATPMVPAAERIKNFADVEGTFTDEEAFIESDCCLGCGYEVVDETKCLGCELCVRLCPKGDVITMVAKTQKEVL
jgi:NADPH-dependent glutamate synthase beta subunit-like oxidoreductase